MEDKTLFKWIFSTTITAMLLCAITAMAQNATDACRPAHVIPLAGGSEPPAKIIIDPPLAGPLASRAVAIYPILCSERAPCPGVRANALAVSPRVGHVQVRLDDAPWV